MEATIWLSSARMASVLGKRPRLLFQNFLASEMRRQKPKIQKRANDRPSTLIVPQKKKKKKSEKKRIFKLLKTESESEALESRGF